MGGPNSHVVFNPKKNIQELQLHQKLMLFSEFEQDHSILDISVSAIFKKIFGFNFGYVLVLFSKIRYDYHPIKS